WSAARASIPTSSPGSSNTATDRDRRVRQRSQSSRAATDVVIISPQTGHRTVTVGARFHLSARLGYTASVMVTTNPLANSRRSGLVDQLGLSRVTASRRVRRPADLAPPQQSPHGPAASRVRNEVHVDDDPNPGGHLR